MMTCVPGMDSIRIAFNEDGEIVEATWKGGGILYLRSTPLLERAGEMREKLIDLMHAVAFGTDEYVLKRADEANNLLDKIASIKKAEGALDESNESD